MKIIFQGTPQQIKKEMETWLETQQHEVSKTDLSKYPFLELDNKGKLSLSKLREVCELHDCKYSQCRQELLTFNEIKQKRNGKVRFLSGIKLKEGQ